MVLSDCVPSFCKLRENIGPSEHIARAPPKVWEGAWGSEGSGANNLCPIAWILLTS